MHCMSRGHPLRTGYTQKNDHNARSRKDNGLVAFALHGVGPIVKINETMDPYQYLGTLKNKMEP